MEHILLPTKIDYKKGSKEHETIVTIEPLYAGYGLTIGNALRRVLLSSLQGGAISAVKIKGVDHEFSTIPYVKEDVVDIILNLKRLKFNVHTDETVTLNLKVKGEKVVTGSDIEGNAQAEVSTLDAPICTLTNKNAQLEMEIMVRKGRGYSPTEMREMEKAEVGTIMVDSIFSPVRNVSMKIENARVGQMTNFNKIVLTIETDGSITAQEAVEAASQIMIDQFKLLKHPGQELPIEDDEDEEANAEALDTIKEDMKEKEEAEEINEGESEEEKPKKKRGRPKKNADE